MPDVIETPPPAVDQTGMLTIWWCPTIANILAPKVAEITAGTRITYSFNPDGWGLDGDQTVDKDERLSLPQDLEALGKATASLNLGYKDSDTAGSAQVVLVEGLSGYFVERRKVLNRTQEAAGQKVRVIGATLGKQIPGPVTGTGKYTTKQKAALTTVVGAPVTIVA